MSSNIRMLAKKGLIKAAGYIPETEYEVLTGSVAYGVSSDNSDKDVVSFCIPPTRILFPHTNGIIPGFGNQGETFKVYQKHHIIHPDNQINYDINVYNIVHFFNLTMNGNPNMIDTLFVPRRCILFSTKIGDIVRDNRKLFLSKKMWHTFKGYAYSSLHKCITKTPNGNRQKYVAEHGYDTKYLYHVVRLLDEIEQILEHGDIDLERAREKMKAVRAGEVSFEEVKLMFELKEKELEKLYASSLIPHKPDETVIKRVLINCIEERYGNIENFINKGHSDSEKTVNSLVEVLKNDGWL